MKPYILTLSLLVALPFAAQAQTKESKTWVNGRAVVVRTETTTQSPAACQVAFDQTVDQQGWHDQIYRAADGEKAFLIYSQRDANVGAVREVKITLWKAMAEKGKTVTETWVYNLKPAEVNQFLDDELPRIAAQFTTSPVRSS